MPPKAQTRITLPVKVFLTLVFVLAGVGIGGVSSQRPGGGASGPVTSPAIERPAAAAGADPLAVQILGQLNTLNERAERIEGKVDTNQNELQGQIKRLQADVDGLKAAQR